MRGNAKSRGSSDDRCRGIVADKNVHAGIESSVIAGISDGLKIGSLMRCQYPEVKHIPEQRFLKPQFNMSPRLSGSHPSSWDRVEQAILGGLLDMVPIRVQNLRFTFFLLAIVASRWALADGKADEMTVSAWARATPPGATTGAIYGRFECRSSVLPFSF